MFVRPNSGHFELLDIACLQEPASQRIVHLYSVELHCLECDHVFCARDGHGMTTVTGGKVLGCPQCAGSQAVANAELARFASQSGDAPRPRMGPLGGPAVARTCDTASAA